MDLHIPPPELPPVKLTFAICCALLAMACSDSDTTGAGGGGTSSNGVGGSTATTTPTTCDYPSAGTPGGLSVGETLPMTLKWMGYTPGAGMAAEVPITSLHDCDGTHGIHALLLSVLQPETAASGNHVSALRDMLPDWSDRGIAVVFLLLRNADGMAVTIEGAADWRQSFMVDEHAWTLADPEFLLVEGGMVDTPKNMLIDPRTMNVNAIDIGHPYDVASLEALADSNAP